MSETSIEEQLEALENDNKKDNKKSNNKNIFGQVQEAFDDFLDVDKQIKAAEKSLVQEKKKDKLKKLKEELKSLRKKNSTILRPIQNKISGLLKELKNNGTNKD